MTIQVFDFFSGCGGASKGFQLAGMNPRFALDMDKDAARTYRANFPQVRFEQVDVTQVGVALIEDVVAQCAGLPKLFCGCAPCQPFTKQNTSKKKKDGRVPLLDYFLTFVKNYLPEYVFVENVPGIQKSSRRGPLSRFVRELKASGYFVDQQVVMSMHYGIPQRRPRLVLLASRLGKIEVPGRTHGPGLRPYETVRSWIGDLPPLAAGAESPEVLNHRASSLSQLNLTRIRATPPGGGWRDWPEDLKLDCHTKRGYDGHSDVYGRMRWNEPAPGLTTRCISLSNGRFGHPEQDRAITVREAASLQTFPRDFLFLGSLVSQARQVGNAVPVELARVIGKHMLKHWDSTGGSANG